MWADIPPSCPGIGMDSAQGIPRQLHAIRVLEPTGADPVAARVIGRTPECPEDLFRLGGDGAGLLLHSSDPFVANCAFTLNVADGSGGGVFVSSSPVMLEAVHFVSNRAQTSGGCIRVSNGVIEVEDCLFIDGRAVKGGGAIDLSYDFDPTPHQELIETVGLPATSPSVSRTVGFTGTTGAHMLGFMKPHAMKIGILARKAGTAACRVRIDARAAVLAHGKSVPGR